MVRCVCSVVAVSILVALKDNYYQSQFPQPCSGSDVATAPLNNALNRNKYRSSVIIVVHIMSCSDDSPAPGPDTRPVDINGEESSCNLSGTNALMPVECIPCRRSCMHTYTWLYSEKVLRQFLRKRADTSINRITNCSTLQPWSRYPSVTFP